jgi:HAMP domain-containing protein
VTLRGHVVEQEAQLPDGRTAVIRIGVPEDSYVNRRELDAVALELTVDGRVEAALSTLLEPSQEDEALALAREVAARLRSGEVEPTAGALEPLANTFPAT